MAYTIETLLQMKANWIYTDFVFFWGHADRGEGLTKACLSQWFPCSFVVDGQYYNCAEQYMMAKKALLAGDLRSYALIMNEPNPQKCKKLGRLVSNLDTAAWDKCKEEVVINANMAKFGQTEPRSASNSSAYGEQTTC